MIDVLWLKAAALVVGASNLLSVQANTCIDLLLDLPIQTCMLNSDSHPVYVDGKFGFTEYPPLYAFFLFK